MTFKNSAANKGRRPTTYFAVGISIFVGFLSYCFGAAPVFWWLIWAGFTLISGSVMMYQPLRRFKEIIFKNRSLNAKNQLHPSGDILLVENGSVLWLDSEDGMKMHPLASDAKVPDPAARQISGP